MKKILCFAAAALILFAGCQKTTVVYDNDGPQEIAVFAVNKVATKAPVSGAEFSSADNMRVSAYLAATDANNAGNIGHYFSNILFSHEDESWVGGQYWPLSAATMNFVAVTQKGGGVDVGEENVTYDESTDAFTITVNNSNELAQTDLMYATSRKANSGNSSAVEAVDMAFNHALAWVNFSFKSNVTTDEILVVNSVALNARYAGIATVTPNNFTSKDSALSATLNWASASKGEELDRNVPNNNNGTMEVMGDFDLANKTVATSYGNGLLVVPSEAGDDPYFVITYTIKQSTEDKQYTYKHVLTDQVWEAGKKYTYNIDINLQEIKVNPTVTPWDDTDENGTPDNPSDDKPWGENVNLG